MSYGKDNDTAQKSVPPDNHADAKSLSLPEGGGAVRVVGEKLAVSPVTCIGSLNFPSFTSSHWR